MSITRLQQARQMYALGQLVSKAMDGSRPGYRGDDAYGGGSGNTGNNTAASSSLGPFTITSSTTKVDTRARARAVALTIKNTAVDTSWKLGTFRLDIHAGGRR